MRFAFIDAQKAHWPVTVQCGVLDVSCSGYYAWKGRPVAPRATEDAELVIEIKAAHKAGRGAYGSPRVHRELRAQGRRIGRKRVERLMRQEGIVARKKRRFRKTTDSNHPHPIAPNVLERHFDVELPNTAWVTDVTYVWTYEGWLYLAVILDLHSRRVVGWAVSDRMKKDLAIRALDMAVRLRQPPDGCLFHSDRGSQYCSYDYQKKLQAHGLRPSMSGKGNCYDNASVETFFKSLKAELIWRHTWPTRRQAEAAIFQYINGFYNTANQLRLFLHAGACWLMWGLRTAMPKRSIWRNVQFDTLRLRLIKIAARVTELKTLIRIQWPTACPNQKIFQVALVHIPRLIT